MNYEQKLIGRSILVAGGSGFLGTSLAEFLSSNGASVTILTRNPKHDSENVQFIQWDGVNLGNWINVLNGCDGLINLTGRSVDCVKSLSHCDEILRSRVDSTNVLGRALRLVESPPPVWVQMSTAHIYGDPEIQRCTEESAIGIGLAPIVGTAWENAFTEAALPSQRKVILRTSFVIGKDRGAGGGALSRLKLIAKLGLGGRVASGKQGISWIHETDMNRIFARSLVDSEWSGIFNATSPNPVSQSEFMKTLRSAMRIPIGLPATEWMVRLGAHFILRTDPELALLGRYVLPKRLKDREFEFKYSDLTVALHEIIANEASVA